MQMWSFKWLWPKTQTNKLCECLTSKPPEVQVHQHVRNYTVHCYSALAESPQLRTLFNIGKFLFIKNSVAFYL